MVGKSMTTLLMSANMEKEEQQPDFHCRTCAFHGLSKRCVKKYSSTADYETCDEYEYTGKFKHQS